MNLKDLKLDKPTTIVRIYNGDNAGDKGVYEIDYKEIVEDSLDLIMLGVRHSISSRLTFNHPCYEYFYGDDAIKLALDRIEELRENKL